MSFLGVLKVAAADTRHFAEAAAGAARAHGGRAAGGLGDASSSTRRSSGGSRSAGGAQGGAARRARRARGRRPRARRAAADGAGGVRAAASASWRARCRRTTRPSSRCASRRPRRTSCRCCSSGSCGAGVHIGNSFIRGFFWARPLSRAGVEEAAVAIQEHDEERVRLKSAVKGADGFFTTFFVSTWSRYVARWAVRLGLTPNQVTVIALCVGLAAASAFATGERAGYIAGAVLALPVVRRSTAWTGSSRATRAASRSSAPTSTRSSTARRSTSRSPGLAIGASSSEVWILAGAMLTLQTLRHSFDFSYGATDRQTIAETPQPPLAQSPDERRRPQRHEVARHARGQARRARVRAATAAELEGGGRGRGRTTGRGPPQPGQKRPLARRILGVWRAARPHSGADLGQEDGRVPDRRAVRGHLHHGARSATPRTTFIVLLAWGGFALLYTSAGRTLRTLAQWRSAAAMSAAPARNRRRLAPAATRSSTTATTARSRGCSARSAGVPAAAARVGAVGLAGLVAAVAAVEGDGASDGLVAAAVAWFVALGGISSGRPHTDRFAWALPGLLRVGEYGAHDLDRRPPCGVEHPPRRSR